MKHSSLRTAVPVHKSKPPDPKKKYTAHSTSIKQRPDKKRNDKYILNLTVPANRKNKTDRVNFRTHSMTFI
ncbi:hypothetical protein ENT52713_46180 [Enterobacter sp. 200527-13]|nr:hypothetical protein ENT52713_46180 [Enterobacter sp. 200527-13]